MEGNIPKDNYVKRRNKKLVTVIEPINNKKVQIHQKRSNSEEVKKNKSKKLIMHSIEAINLITKGPSINKLFFKNDNISLKSESVPKQIKKGVKKYKSITIDKGKIAIYNNIKLQKLNESNVKLSNNTVNNLNIDAIEKSKELKGSTKDFNPYTNQVENNIKKPRKPNFINKNCISNDKLIIYNNQIKTNPIIEFYQPLKDNEIKKNAIQKFQSVQQEKKNSKFSDCRIHKQLKEEDLNGSLDNINPEEYRGGKTNIELISHNDSYVENDVSSSLSSNDEEQNNEIIKNKTKNKNDTKIKNQISLNSNNMPKKIEKSSNKNVYAYNNNDIDENYFKNDITFFRSPQIYSNRTSNKSLKSDQKGDYFNNFVLNMNDSINCNIDNYNKNYAFENMINKSIIKKFGSLNSNTDFEKENEDENELNERLNKSNTFLDYSKNFVNISTINDSFNHCKIKDKNSINNNNDNNSNINNMNYINENNNIMNNDLLYKTKINNKYNESIDNNKNNYYNKENLNCYYQGNNGNNINTINIVNNNLNNSNFNNDISLNNLVRNLNHSHIINIQNMNNFNNNNFILNPNQMNPFNSTNNVLLDYNVNRSKSNNIKENSQFIYNKNNIFDFNSNIRNNTNQNNLYGYVNNNHQISDYNLNNLKQQNYLMNNNAEFINNMNQNKIIINNQNYIPNNDIFNNKSINNNSLFNSNNIYNLNQQNNNLYNNNLNSNYSWYNNLNNINQNINNAYPQNDQYKFNNQRKMQKKSNYYQKNKFMNQNVNTPNNCNYMMNNRTNNYNNLNNNINLNNRNININNNDSNNFSIPNNMNYYQNLNNSRFYNNSQNQSINNYQIINQIPYMNNRNNNIMINKPNIKNNSNRQRKQNWNSLSNEDLAKQAFNFVKNKNGCRYLQKRVEKHKDLVPTLFFPHILGHFEELSNDQFGNYYIKIIIKYLPDDMIFKLISLIHPSFTKIGTNQYGTKVIQYLIEFLKDEKNLVFFIDKIIPHVVNLINDLNGIHIIQRLICIKSQYIQLIYNNIYENIELISVTRDGSNFIMKKLFDFLDEQNLVMLLNSINQKLDKIIIDQFGNYIIQNIIAKFDINMKYQIIENIIKNLVLFSNQKFSSNVVEKCFETEIKGKVIDEILKGNNFELLLLNEYGNYVVQKAINKADKNKQHLLLKTLVPLVDKLQKRPFGQKLLQKLFVIYPKLSIYILNC